jgi:hypothetical protein
MHACFIKACSLPVVQDTPASVSHLDPDTAISHHSFTAALTAAGACCQAVDDVMAGKVRLGSDWLLLQVIAEGRLGPGGGTGANVALVWHELVLAAFRHRELCIVATSPITLLALVCSRVHC